MTGKTVARDMTGNGRVVVPIDSFTTAEVGVGIAYQNGEACVRLRLTIADRTLWVDVDQREARTIAANLRHAANEFEREHTDCLTSYHADATGEADAA